VEFTGICFISIVTIENTGLDATSIQARGRCNGSCSNLPKYKNYTAKMKKKNYNFSNLTDTLILVCLRKLKLKKKTNNLHQVK
jgi:hypothetical protein